MKYLILMATVFALTACKQNAKNVKSKTSPSTVQTSSELVINGNAMLGPVKGASVTAYPVLSNGELDLSNPIGSAKTNNDGNYSLKISDKKSLAGAIGVQVSGGEYKEESTGETVSLNDSSLTAVLPKASAGTQVNAAVGPLSDIAYQVFKSNIQNINDQSKSTSEQAIIANEKVAKAFGLNDIISTLPSRPEGKIPNNSNGQFTVVLSALSVAAKNAGTDSVAISDAFAKHMIENGNFASIGTENLNVTNADGRTISIKPPTLNNFSALVNQIGSGKVPVTGLVTDPNFEPPKIVDAPVSPAPAQPESQSCFITNGTGSQKWNGSNWEVCQVVACNTNYKKIGNSCEALSRQCSVANGSGSQTWGANKANEWGNCNAISCNANYSLGNNSCTAVTKTCSADNGQGTQTWTGAAWSACSINSCAANYSKVNNVCVANTQSCSANNGTGVQTWGGSSWGSCVLSACKANYTKNGNICVANTQECSITNGKGSQVWNGANWSVCSVSSCQANYTNLNNSCVASARSCTIENGTGSQSLVGSTWGACQVTSCKASYSNVNNRCALSCPANYVSNGSSCVAATQSCAIANGTGSQSWNGSSWGACSLVSCNSSFHASANTCEYNTKGCSISNAASAMQSWNGSSWGACNVITCNSGYTNSSNSCVSNTVGTKVGSGTNSGTSNSGCPAGWICPATPIYTSKIGAWYSLYWNPPGAPFSHWADWTRYKPTIGYYGSDDPAVITTHFSQMKSAGVNFVIFDDTNGITNDGGTIDRNARAIVSTNANLGENAQLKFSFAIGYGLWFHKSVSEHDIEANYIWNQFAQNPQHFTIDGKPLLVNYNGYESPSCFQCNWNDSRFSVRYAGGMIDGSNPVLQKYSANGMWGWAIKTPQLASAEGIAVMPGWHTRHLDRDTTPIDREGGLYYMKQWLFAIKQNPRHIIIASWNDWAEESSIEPAYGIKAPKFTDSYGTETPDLYLQITAGYGNLRTGLMNGYYYKDEDNSTVYQVSNGNLVAQGAMPRGKAVIYLPAGTISKLAGSGPQPATPVAGGWSSWTNIGTCNPSTQTVTQSRACNNPAPANGGAACAGPTSQAIACTPGVINIGATTPLPEGLFKVGVTLGYSNGTSAYCLFGNMVDFTAITGKTDATGIRLYSQIPAVMANDGYCVNPNKPVTPTTIPAGLFKVGVTLGYSAGSAYCLFDTMANFTRLTGKTNASGILEYPSIPSTMRNDGICQGQ